MKKVFIRLVQNISLWAYKKDAKQKTFEKVLYSLMLIYPVLLGLTIFEKIHALMTFFIMFCIGMLCNLVLSVQLYMSSDKNSFIALFNLKKEMSPEYESLLKLLERKLNRKEITDAEFFRKKEAFENLKAKQACLALENDPAVKKEMREEVERLKRVLTWSMIPDE
jgi:hypothetical protein